MERLGIRLFGKLTVDYAGKALQGCEAQKVQELLCYLLLHRNHPQPREILASLLWGDSCTTAHSRKYLRNALWRLQSAMSKMPDESRKQLLTAESDWIEFRSGPQLELDVEELEAAYSDVLGTTEQAVSEEQVRRLERAAGLYIGYLLSGWSHDWCISERDRLHHIYLLVIEKIAGYYENAGKFESALSWAEGALTYDRAHESTHRRMMRLYYKMGYRTDALRQFHRCVAALKDELDVEPTQRTMDLYEALRQDRGGISDISAHWHAA
jgi:DNA-binding SARP family transcriptional activator